MLFIPPINLVGGGAAFDADVVAWAAQVVTNGGTVSGGRKTLLSTMVAGLKSDGIWSKLDRLWIFAAENTFSSLVDLVTRATATKTNSPTFVTDRGWSGVTNNGTDWLDTGYNPGNGGGPYLFLQNDAHLSVWNTIDQIVSSYGDCGNASTGASIQWFAGSLYMRLNDADSAASSQPAHGNGHFLSSRDTSATKQLYQNGASFTSSTQASTAIINANMNVLAEGGIQGAGSADEQAAMFSAGSHLSSTQASNFYSRLRTYMTAVGVP